MKTYIPEGEDAITFRGIGGDIIFEDNSAWMAGAIYAYAGTVDGQEGTGGGMTINGVTGDVIFRNNRADAGDKASDYNGNFGAIYSGQDMDIFNVQGDLRFEGNHASNSAGAFRVSGSFNLDNVGSITFIGNHAEKSYAVGMIDENWNVTNTGDITISGNSSGVQMGGVAVFGNTTFSNNGDITVENKTLDDQVLIKRDGMPTYNFANVIDDHLMGIIIRQVIITAWGSSTETLSFPIRETSPFPETSPRITATEPC